MLMAAPQVTLRQRAKRRSMSRTAVELLDEFLENNRRRKKDRIAIETIA